MEEIIAGHLKNMSDRKSQLEIERDIVQSQYNDCVAEHGEMHDDCKMLNAILSTIINEIALLCELVE